MTKLSYSGFKGIFFSAAEKEKAIIVVTGSDGGIKWAKQIADAFAFHGVPSLAIASGEQNIHLKRFRLFQ